jgi:hypothetical protein
MDKPTLRVLHGVPTNPVRLDSRLTPHDLGRFSHHQSEQPRRAIRAGRLVRRLYAAVVTALAVARTGRFQRPVSPVVAVEDRASM